MPLPADIDTLAAAAGWSVRRRASLVTAAALVNLTLRRRVALGGERVQIFSDEPTGDPPSDVLLAAITRRRRPPTVDRALSLRNSDVGAAVDRRETSLVSIRKLLEQTLADHTDGHLDTPRRDRALAGLAVAAGLASYPGRKGRDARGMDAGLLIVGDLPLLVKAAVAAVAGRHGGVGVSPSDLVRTLRRDREGAGRG